MPEGAAVGVGHHGHVDPGLLHGEEGVVERGAAAQHEHPPDPARAAAGGGGPGPTG